MWWRTVPGLGRERQGAPPGIGGTAGGPVGETGPVLLHDVGPRAVLVEVGDAGEAHALAAWARERGGAEDVVPGATTVLLDGLEPAELPRLREDLRDWRPGSRPEPGPLLEVPVVYDGPDLGDVARLWGTDVDGVVDLHTSLELTAAFCGFAPGFAYLAGLPAERSVPRLDSPRTRVPPGSVAVAGTWCAVYPHASPGGWRLLGRTDLRMWDANRPDPALITPGTRVRFRTR